MAIQPPSARESCRLYSDPVGKLSGFLFSRKSSGSWNLWRWNKRGWAVTAHPGHAQASEPEHQQNPSWQASAFQRDPTPQRASDLRWLKQKIPSRALGNPLQGGMRHAPFQQSPNLRRLTAQQQLLEHEHPISNRLCRVVHHSGSGRRNRRGHRVVGEPPSVASSPRRKSPRPSSGVPRNHLLPDRAPISNLSLPKLIPTHPSQGLIPN